MSGRERDGLREQRLGHAFGSQGRGGHGGYGGQLHSRQGRGGYGGQQHVGQRRQQGYQQRAYETRLNEIWVVTNMFRMNLMADTVLYQYDVQIERMRRAKDENGNPTENFEVAKSIFSLPTAGDSRQQEEVALNNRSSQDTRAILTECQKLCRESNKQDFVTDGESIAYSTELLVQQKDIDEPDQKKARLEDATNDRADKVSYRVKVVNEVRRKGWFQVSFTPTATIPMREVLGKIVTDKYLHQAIVAAFANTTLKNSMMLAGMLTSGRSPHMFFFHELHQLNQLIDPRGLRAQLNEAVMPLLGLNPSASITSNGDLFLVMDIGIGWAYNEIQRDNKTGEERPRPILNVNADGSGTIVDAPIANVHEPIPPGHRKLIREKIKKVGFHAAYERSAVSGQWASKMRNRGKTGEWILENRRFEKRDMRVYFKGEEDFLIWATDDHKFPVKRPNGEMGDLTTVKDYYKSAKGIALKYPKMPLVRCSKDEYFPIEFLNQALGKFRDASSEKYTKPSLQFSDHFAVKERIDRIIAILHSQDPDTLNMVRDFRSILHGFLESKKFTVAKEPERAKARVLEEPTLRFENESSRARVNDGSFNLNQVGFADPAELQSWAVIDYTRADNVRLFQELFKSCRKHEMVLTDAESVFSRIVEKPDNYRDLDLGSIHRHFNAAIKNSRSLFLQARLSKTIPYFMTQARSPKGDCCQCWVKWNDDSSCIVIPPNRPGVEGWQRTHHVKLKADGQWYPARIKYRIELAARPKIDVDLFDLKYRGHDIYEFRVDERWQKVLSFAPFYEVAMTPGLRIIKGEDELAEMKEVGYTEFQSGNVCCPSVVFVVLPDDDPQKYTMIKFMAMCVFGLQSQVVVKAKFDSQGKRADQYCSNVALKLNAKLATFHDKVSAWRSVADRWVDEAPTLIIGIAMASTPGKDAKMAVVGTASLDRRGLKIVQSAFIQRKSGLIANSALTQIVTSLAAQYFVYNNETKPKRVVIYRSGGDDGLFAAILNKELIAIKQAFCMLNGLKECSECQKKGFGCVFCLPKFTINQHNKRIVPHDPTWQKKNVPSGTCLGEECNLFSSMRSGDKTDDPDANKGNHSFLLVAHGGLKGTSKPVYYRPIWNENFILYPQTSTGTPLTCEHMQQMTYDLSFMYATATKAPRLPSVLNYSERFAHQIIGYIGYLFDPKSVNPFLEELDDPDGIYKRENKDGRVAPGFDPCTLKHIDTATGSHVKNVFITPFHPHTSA